MLAEGLHLGSCFELGLTFDKHLAMAKALIVSSIQVFPPLSGGQLRSAQLAQTLAELGHHVDIYSWTARKESYVNFKQDFIQHPATGVLEHVNCFFLWGVFQWLFYKLRLPPIWIYLTQKLWVPRRLLSMANQCDLVIFDFPFVFNERLAAQFKGKTLLNTHNCEYDLFQVDDKNQPFKALKSLWLAFVKVIEQRAVSESSFVACCSELDLKRIQSLYDSVLMNEQKMKYSIIPNGVNSGLYLKPGEFNRAVVRWELGYHPTKRCFVFPGSSFGPNQEGLLALKNWIGSSRNRLSQLGIEFWIIGSVAEKDLSDPLIKCTGPVTDVKPYLWAADFGINPVQSGSGVNVKMIEFISTHLVALSTRVGMRGLRLDSKTSFLIDKDSFLSMIEKACLLTQGEYLQMARSAYEQNKDLIDMKESLFLLSKDMGLSVVKKVATINAEKDVI